MRHALRPCNKNSQHLQFSARECPQCARERVAIWRATKRTAVQVFLVGLADGTIELDEVARQQARDHADTLRRMQ